MSEHMPVSCTLPLVITSMPLRMMWNPGAIAAAAQDLTVNGHCLLLMDENDDQAGLPDASCIIADYPLASGAMLRRRLAQAVISACFEDVATRLRFHTDVFGTPKLTGTPIPLHVSYSARGSMGLVGIGNTPLGVDLELPISPDEIPLNILRDDERRALMAQREITRVSAFLRLWTLKEAMVKANGRGFYVPPEQVFVADQRATIALSKAEPAPMISGTILTAAPIRAFTPWNKNCDERRILDAYVAAIALNEGSQGNRAPG